MRKPKYRVWDKDSETMVYGVGITPETDGSTPYKIAVSYADYDQFDYYPNGVLMQYTGLKDKNGKMIYEGDICFIQIYDNSGNPSEDESFNTKVVFRKNAFQLVDKDGDTWTEWLTVYKGEDTEVIGNIYENSELLKEGAAE